MYTYCITYIAVFLGTMMINNINQPTYRQIHMAMGKKTTWTPSDHLKINGIMDVHHPQILYSYMYLHCRFGTMASWVCSRKRVSQSIASSSRMIPGLVLHPFNHQWLGCGDREGRNMMEHAGDQVRIYRFLRWFEHIFEWFWVAPVLGLASFAGLEMIWAHQLSDLSGFEWLKWLVWQFLMEKDFVYHWTYTVFEHCVVSVVFTECVAMQRFPFHSGGSGGWGCVFARRCPTVRNRPQLSATVRDCSQPSAGGRYGSAYGKFCKRRHFRRWVPVFVAGPAL